MSHVVLAIVLSALAPSHSPGLNQDPEPLDAAVIYERSIKSIVLIRNKGDGFGSLGTGFLVYDSQTIATAWHVIKDAEELTVTFSDGTVVKVEGVLDTDRGRDLALLKIRKTTRAPLTIRKDDPTIGAPVYAIGNPRGLKFSICDGIWSPSRMLFGSKHYQHSAETTFGYSGCPLFDAQGRVVGVARSKYKGESALNFASPAVGLDLLQRDDPPGPMPADISGTFAWSFRQAVGLPQALAGRKEVLLVTEKELVTLDVRTGKVKVEYPLSISFDHDRFVSNRDGSVIAVFGSVGTFSLALLHRLASGAYASWDRGTYLYSGPLISESGTVYNIVQTSDGLRIEALDVAKGAILWSKYAQKSLDLEYTERAYFHQAGLTLIQSKLLVVHAPRGAPDGPSTVSVVDAKTGERMWTRKDMGATVTSPLGMIYYYTARPAAIVNFEDWRVSKSPRYVKGVVAETGKEVSSRINDNGIISVGPYGTVYLSENGDLIAMNPQLTAIKWSLTLGSAVAHHAVFDNEGSLFAPLEDGRMIAVDASSGRLRWTYASGRNNYFAGPASIEDGFVVAKNKDGSVMAIHD